MSTSSDQKSDPLTNKDIILIVLICWVVLYSGPCIVAASISNASGEISDALDRNTKAIERGK